MTSYRKNLEGFIALGLPKNRIAWSIYRNRKKILLGVVLIFSLILSTGIKADEVQSCMDDPNTSWDTIKWRCVVGQ